jgi:hypothetical protein
MKFNFFFKKTFILLLTNLLNTGNELGSYQKSIFKYLSAFLVEIITSRHRRDNRGQVAGALFLVWMLPIHLDLESNEGGPRAAYDLSFSPFR